MKRKTIQWRNSPLTNTARKHKTEIINFATLNLLSRYRTNHNYHFSQATNIIGQVMKEVLDSAFDSITQICDNQQAETQLQQLNFIFDQVETSLRPKCLSDDNIIHPLRVENEPDLIEGDLLCGRATIQIDQKTKTLVRLASFASSTSIKESRFHHSSMRNCSNLNRGGSKMKLNEKNSLKPLKINGIIQNHTIQDSFREKILRETSNIKIFNDLKKTKIDSTTNEKSGNIPTTAEQYSFDYDGSVFPILKVSKRNNQKLNILNATYKFSPKEKIENAKLFIPCKIKITTIENKEIDKNDRNSGEDEIPHVNLSKKHTSQSMRGLNRAIGGDRRDLLFYSKLQDFMKDKSKQICPRIKIKQLRMQQ